MAPTAAATRHGLRRVLVALCVTEITSWGILFYAFPVLAGRITATTGWSATAITAAFSAGQLVSAGVGVAVGRRLDRRGPRAVMTAGSALGVLAVLVIATAPNLTWFFAGWLLAGAAMAATLYPPAFAALTRWHGPDRVKALTVLTLAAGLASTVFAPLTAVLTDHLDWRGAYLVLAAVLAAVTIPGHWFGLRLPWPPAPPPAAHHAADPGAVARSRAFLMLGLALAVAAFATFSVVITLVPLMAERGVDTATAALALGLGGAGQVAGRIGYSALSRRTSVRTRTLLVLLAMAATTALLGVLTTVTALIAASIAAGTARGVFTLLQATAVTDRWGATHYGHLSGLLSAPLAITMAMAPFAATAVADLLDGYAVTYLLLGALTAVAALLSLATTPKHTTP